MTGDHQDDIGMDHLDMQLFTLGEEALPDGFDSRLKSFGEMMAAIEDMTIAAEDQLDGVGALNAELGELAQDAFELGLGYLDRGDLDRAEHWLERAVRYGLSRAQDKLADLAELRTALADIDLDFLRTPGSLSALERVITEKLSVEAPSVAQANESAQAIIDDARRRAESIIALAKLRTHRSPATREHLTGQNARTTLLLEGSDDALRVDILATALSLTNMSRSILPQVLVTIPPGVGKTDLYSKLLSDAASSGQRIVVVVNSYAAASDLATRWPRLRREWMVTAARSTGRSFKDRIQDELLQLYEFTGGNVDELRRTADWHLRTQNHADGGREASGEVVLECKTFTRTLTQHFDLYSLGKAMFDLIGADASRLMVPDAWQEHSDGLIVPSGVRAEPVTASSGKG